MKLPTRNHRRGEEGIALIYVAIFLLVSLWFVSLAVDVGKLMAAKTELQAAADAAALAAASAINPVTAALDQDEAKVRAASAASSNHAYQDVKTSVVINPDVDVEFPAARQVKVTVYRDIAHDNPVILQFAQTLGLRRMGVTADATAEAGPLVGLCEGLAPFAPEQLPNGADFVKDCGTTYTLKLGAGNSTTGNFQLLSYPECAEDDFTGGGGSAVRYYTTNGWDCCFNIGDMIEVDTKPGNTVGPLQQGLQARWDADTDHNAGCYQSYNGNQKRVFLCPIIKDFSVNGKSTVQIVRFAAFFLTQRPTGSMVQQGVQGQFIDYVAPGVVGDVPPTATDIYGVHLIE